MRVIPIKTTIFSREQPIISFITNHISSVQEQTVLVITSKIVALAEGRVYPLTTKEEKDALIQQESDVAVRTPWSWLTKKNGQIYNNAGIDESNVGDGYCVLLPNDSFLSARHIWQQLRMHYRIDQLGIIITDSRTPMLRQGSVGVALGFAGFEGLQDYRTTPDLFGRPFRYARANHVDSLAAAAVFMMGEGDECQPLALITDAPVVYTERDVSAQDVYMSLDDDMYAPFIQTLLSR